MGLPQGPSPVEWVGLGSLPLYSLPRMLCHWAKNIGTWPGQDDTSSWHLGLASVRGCRAGLGCGLLLLLLLLRLSPLLACSSLGVVGRSLSSCASGTALPSLMVTRSRNVEVIWWVSTSLCHLVSLLLTPFVLRAWKIRHWGGRGREGGLRGQKIVRKTKRRREQQEFFLKTERKRESG